MERFFSGPLILSTRDRLPVDDISCWPHSVSVPKDVDRFASNGDAFTANLVYKFSGGRVNEEYDVSCSILMQPGFWR